jgi:serine/threonine-protein kinase RsbW
MASPARFDMPLDAPNDVVFSMASAPLAVRDGLRDILAHPLLARLAGETRGDAEVVLAEVFNNIVEHAYDRPDGEINLRMRQMPGHLLFEIADAGLPMPGLRLPKGLAQPIGSHENLPEGGFGWFLIRSLTENLCYRRIDGHNYLSFQLKVEQ